MDLKRAEKRLAGDRVVLVGLDGHGDGHESALAELSRLARTAGAEVAGQLLQRRPRPDPATYVGAGKARELAGAARTLGARTVLTDDDLTPGQQRQLEKITGCRVLDRSEVIMEIFALRARTRQAMIQVELARLEYARPRLKRMWTHLSRIEGGIGFRGPGEKQIEEDRRTVNRRIQELKRRLEGIGRRRQREIDARRPAALVGLVGYTNAGKSTLLNALTGAAAPVEDKLFSTLDTRTRRWELMREREVFLSDTVGFIRKLPHHLVASFHATLAAAGQADLLLHVADASHPRVARQVQAVEEVLAELGCGDQPTLLVLNKLDWPGAEEAAHLLRPGREIVEISALTGRGLEELAGRVREKLKPARVRVSVRVPVKAGGAPLALLEQSGQVLERKYGTREAKIQAWLDPILIASLGRMGAKVSVLPEAAAAEEAAS